MVKELSSQAQCAKDIKAELKKVFPSVKFRIRSSSFSGGNSVDVNWDLGPTTKQVDAITKKYQHGYFDGMDDSYNYVKVSTPSSAKFVQTQRTVPQDVMVKASVDYAALLGEPIPAGRFVFDHKIARQGEYISTLVHQLIGTFDLTAGGYQGIELAKDEFGNEELGLASRLDEFYTCIGGTRIPRY